MEARTHPGQLQVGDTVIRKRRVLKTRGQVVKISDETRDGVRLLWVKWAHERTLPNPSLELEDTLERITLSEADTAQG